MPSLTTTNENMEREGPILEVHFLISKELEEQYKKENKKIPEPVIIKALIDTGASMSVIQQEIPEKLGLKPVGSTIVNTPSCNSHPCYNYFMRMVIPSHNLIYQGVFVATPLKEQNIKCLIGRDLLKDGIFIYIGYANQFTLSLL